MIHSTSSFPEFPGLTSLTLAMISKCLKKAELRVAEVKLLVKSRTLCFFFFNRNVVFPAQGKYSYFSAYFTLKIFLYYS